MTEGALYKYVLFHFNTSNISNEKNYEILDNLFYFYKEQSHSSLVLFSCDLPYESSTTRPLDSTAITFTLIEIQAYSHPIILLAS
jgi:hypothetical protein